MEHRQQTIQLPYHKYQFLPGLSGLYLYTLLRDIGRGLVTIYVPVYIFQLTGSLVWPFLLYACYHVLAVLNALWAPYLIRVIGIDWSAAIGAVLRALTLTFLILSEGNIRFLWLAFTCWGFLIVFTWVPHHYTVLEADGGDHKFGKKSSLVLIFQQLASAVSPVVGGLIVFLFGFSKLYAVALVFVILSALPMFLDKIKKRQMRFSVKQLVKDTFDPKLRKINLGLVGEGFEGNSIMVLWPLFIYFHVGAIYKLGIVTTAALAISLLALFFLGRHIDKKGKKWARPLFVLFLLVWLAKPVFRHTAGFVAVDSLYYILVSLVFLVYNTMMYEFATVRRRMEFLVRREVLYHAAALASCLLIALGIYVLDFWIIGFVLAGVGVWLIQRAVFKKD